MCSSTVNGLTTSGHSQSRLRQPVDKPKGEIGKDVRHSAGPKLAGMNAFASIEHRIKGRRVSIGSTAANDLILAHKSVAARHAIIRRTRRGCYIRDLGSESGTFLNGRRIEREEPLRDGDELRFGAARFAMVAGSQPTSRFVRYVGAALGLMVLAAAGYLAVNFVRNWENLEQLASSPLKPAGSASVSAPNGVSPASGPPAWLAAINEYRVGVKLPPVAEDPKLSDADRKHAMYLVKNYEDKVSGGHLLGAEMHEEEKGNPWYTPEGHDAAALSDVNQLLGLCESALADVGARRMDGRAVSSALDSESAPASRRLRRILREAILCLRARFGFGRHAV